MPCAKEHINRDCYARNFFMCLGPFANGSVMLILIPIVLRLIHWQEKKLYEEPASVVHFLHVCHCA